MNSEALSQKCFSISRIKYIVFLIVPFFAFAPFPVVAIDVTEMPATNSVPAESPSEKPPLTRLSNLSIEELLNTKVTILGPSETVSRTPAAVSVVTQDDIRRSGAMNIPEALRGVPGLDVAQIDASQWAVSSRGFNQEFANKLLVLQDGRSIYTPLFGGVFWDVQGTMMADIDRIEVVRGPGATLWGANAVNGVINILTKSAEDTQGWLVDGGGGTFERGFADARYGGKIGDNLYYRVYGSYQNHDDTPLPNGDDSQTQWQLGRGGFRMDWNQSSDNLVTFQTDGYGGEIEENFLLFDPGTFSFNNTAVDMRAKGVDVLGRWTHTISDTSDFKLQVYYDRTERLAPQLFNETLDTVDVDFRHEFAVGDRNKVMWGLGYRLSSDTEVNTPTVGWTDDNLTLNLFSGFAQDEIVLVSDRLTLTLGSKVERNDYTKFEFEPGARLLWTPVDRHTFWASVSRAVRTPTRSSENLVFNESPGVTLYGNDDQQSEDLYAYELGYRTQPLDQLSFDVTAFYNDYHRLESIEFVPGLTPPPGYPFPTSPITFRYGNGLDGHSYGTELSATWEATRWWRLQPSYTFFKLDLQNRPGSTDTTSIPLTESQSPENQFSLRSMMDLPHDVTLDVAVRYVDRLALTGFTPVNSYVTADARLAWRIRKNLELSIVGQSLLQKQHGEYSSIAILANGQTQVPRSVYGKVTWQF